MDKAIRLEREKRKTAREQRVFNLLMDPAVKRLLLLAGIVAYTSYVTGKQDAGRTESALAVALPTAGIPMLAADAGITDWRVLMALGAISGSVAAIASDKAVDAVTIEGPGGYPLLSLLGPIAGLRFAAGKIDEWKEAQH